MTCWEAARWLFGGDEPALPLAIHQVCARGVAVYLGGVLAVRFGKSRLIGVAAHWTLTRFALHAPRLESFLKGHSVVLVRDGRLHEGALRRTHLSHEDLLEGLRHSGVEGVDEVHLAVKERSGEISVIER